MPRSYKVRPLGLDPCPARSLLEFKAAAALLGDTAVHGCELSFELRSLGFNPPSRATGEAWMRQAFVLLQGMLVAERWLIEFLTGPAAPVDAQTQKRRKRDGDICVNCFVHDWRFPAGQLADELVGRLDPIHTLAAHPTWAQVTASPRQWTLTRVASCANGLAIFAHAVRPERPTVAAILDERIDVARQSLQTGRSDGLRWFDLVAPLMSAPLARPTGRPSVHSPALYTPLYMASTRTQIYLTKEQRAKLDALAKREEKTLAELIREAVDRYLETEPSAADRDRILAETFGAIPDLEVPPRSEWDRGYG